MSIHVAVLLPRTVLYLPRWPSRHGRAGKASSTDGSARSRHGSNRPEACGGDATTRWRFADSGARSRPGRHGADSAESLRRCTIGLAVRRSSGSSPRHPRLVATRCGRARARIVAGTAGSKSFCARGTAPAITLLKQLRIMRVDDGRRGARRGPVTPSPRVGTSSSDTDMVASSKLRSPRTLRGLVDAQSPQRRPSGSADVRLVVRVVLPASAVTMRLLEVRCTRHLLLGHVDEDLLVRTVDPVDDASGHEPLLAEDPEAGVDNDVRATGAALDSSILPMLPSVASTSKPVMSASLHVVRSG